MALKPGFTDPDQLSRDEAAIFNCFAVSSPIARSLFFVLRVLILFVPHLVDSQDMSPSMAVVSPNVQPQLSYTLPLETSMGASLIQDLYGTPHGTTQGPYFVLEGAPDSSSTTQPRSIATSSGNNVSAQSFVPRQPCRIQSAWFHRFIQHSGTRSVGWIYRMLVSRNLLRSSPSSHRYVCSRCMFSTSPLFCEHLSHSKFYPYFRPPPSPPAGSRFRRDLTTTGVDNGISSGWNRSRLA